MTRLNERKSKLMMVTSETARYRSQNRPIVIEVTPYMAICRLHGTRTRYPISWRAVFDRACIIAANMAREERKAKRRKPV